MKRMLMLSCQSSQQPVMRSARKLRSLTALLSPCTHATRPALPGAPVSSAARAGLTRSGTADRCWRQCAWGSVHRAVASMAHSQYETVRVDIEDAIGTITISRPKALNALSDKVRDAERCCVRRVAFQLWCTMMKMSNALCHAASALASILCRWWTSW